MLYWFQASHKEHITAPMYDLINEQSASRARRMDISLAIEPVDRLLERKTKFRGK